MKVRVLHQAIMVAIVGAFAATATAQAPSANDMSKIRA